MIAAGHFSYSLVEGTNEVYSWGMGDNYVLGNRNDRNEHKPYLVDSRMFENNKVLQIACGSNHIVVLTQEQGTDPPIFDPTQFINVPKNIENASNQLNRDENSANAVIQIEKK